MRSKLFLTLFAAFLLAAFVAPGGATAETLAIQGGTVHPVTAEPYVGTVVIEDGVIRAAGADVTPPAGATVLDASGLHVYPGFFDALSQLGLVEIGAVAATDDSEEMGAYNAHLKAATAIHPASQLFPVARAEGITHTLVAPDDGSDNVIVGQGSLVHLDGWTVEEMAIEPSAAMVIYWPEIETRSFDFSTFTLKETPYTEAKEEAEEKQRELADWLQAARHYAQAAATGSDRVERNLRLEALAEVLDRGKPVIIHANEKADIEAAVEFADQQGLAMILAGGRDAWKVKDLLAEKAVPVILSFTHGMPPDDDDPYDRAFTTAGELRAAGIPVAFASGTRSGGGGPGGPHASRTLPFEAAAAVPFGLGSDEAIRALTLYPAEMLGLGDKLGSIDAGKIGNLVVTTGDPLEVTTRVEHVVINGREVSTANKHRDLYEKYKSRPLP